MPRCSAGHDSGTSDYCDVCGSPIAPVPARPAPAGTSVPDRPAAPAGAPSDPAQRCAQCGGPRAGRFCEECGHDSMLPARSPAPAPSPVGEAAPVGAPAPAFAAPPRPADPIAAPHPAPENWSATVRADHAWYEEMQQRSNRDPAVLLFPQYCPERRFDLTGAQLVIGRRNRARGVDPEIDLSGPPLDPGVSTLHAMLLSRPDGGWEVVDLGSTNGTVVGNGDPIPPNTPRALTDGDQIKIGAWTTITVAHRSASH